MQVGDRSSRRYECDILVTFLRDVARMPIISGKDEYLPLTDASSAVFSSSS